MVLALLLAAGTPSACITTVPTLVYPQQTICMTMFDFDHLCFRFCLRVVFIGDEE